MRRSAFQGVVVAALTLAGCPTPKPPAPHRRAPRRPSVPTRWRAVSAGIDHTCAVAADRSAWCWGNNQWGQLGDATLTDRDGPTRVLGLGEAAQIAAGYRRTFALTARGELWGWGAVKSGLPPKERLHYARPRRVPIPEPVRDYRIGQRSCALTRAGNLWCWRGRWGAQPRKPAATPRRLTGLPPMADFDSGSDHFCGVDKAARVWCWGKNGAGQLGDGSRQARVRAVRVGGLPAMAAVVCGSESTCAVDTTGAVWCWGRVGPPQPSSHTPLDEPEADLPAPGQPVGPQPTPVLRPRRLAGLTGVVSLVLGWPHTWARTRDGRVLRWRSVSVHSAPRERIKSTGRAAGLRFGSEHRCVLDTSGRVRCWGENSRGQLGDATFERRSTPTPVRGVPRLKQLSVGNVHACGLSPRGRIWCWGDDSAGQLGLGAPTRWRTPRGASPTLRAALHGAAGYNHACAIKPDRSVWCWGSPSFAARSTLVYRYRYTPRRQTGVRGAVALASFSTTTCALLADTTVWCWGDGLNHTLGRPRGHDQPPRPGPVYGLRGATHLSVGHDHACAIKGDRSVWCWGGRFHRRPTGGPRPAHGKTTAPAPTQRVFAEAIALASGWQHSCAIRRDGTVWCWGANDRGSLGDSPLKPLGRPVQVRGIRQARSVAAGFLHSCATTGDGSVWCWGDNRQGQLGTPSPRQSPTARRVPGVPKAAAVYAGNFHSCARTAKGRLWCWGRTMSARRLEQAPQKPSPMPGLRPVTHAWLGDRFTCALERGGAVRCWGDNPQGQLGRRPVPHHARPVRLGGAPPE